MNAGFLDFLKGNTKKAAPAKIVRPTITPEPSFNVPFGLLAISGLSFYEGLWPIGGFAGILGAFLVLQATRIRFVFDDEAVELKRNGEETDNIVVGGQNRWTYDSFVNWEFWWPGFPVLVYFKETQTKPEGQIHFFPIIVDGKALYQVMSERCGPSKGSSPKKGSRKGAEEWEEEAEQQ